MACECEWSSPYGSGFENPHFADHMSVNQDTEDPFENAYSNDAPTHALQAHVGDMPTTTTSSTMPPPPVPPSPVPPSPSRSDDETDVEEQQQQQHQPQLVHDYAVADAAGVADDDTPGHPHSSGVYMPPPPPSPTSTAAGSSDDRLLCAECDFAEAAEMEGVADGVSSHFRLTSTADVQALELDNEHRYVYATWMPSGFEVLLSRVTNKSNSVPMHVLPLGIMQLAGPEQAHVSSMLSNSAQSASFVRANKCEARVGVRPTGWAAAADTVRVTHSVRETRRSKVTRTTKRTWSTTPLEPGHPLDKTCGSVVNLEAGVHVLHFEIFHGDVRIDEAVVVLDVCRPAKVSMKNTRDKNVPHALRAKRPAPVSLAGHATVRVVASRK